jgi:hypothetical protein
MIVIKDFTIFENRTGMPCYFSGAKISVEVIQQLLL